MLKIMIHCRDHRGQRKNRMKQFKKKYIHNKSNFDEESTKLKKQLTQQIRVRRTREQVKKSQDCSKPIQKKNDKLSQVE